MTNYTILKLDDATQNWEFEAVNIKASSSRRALSAAKVGEGTYVAIPASSFKPLVVKVETVSKVSIS